MAMFFPYFDCISQAKRGLSLKPAAIVLAKSLVLVGANRYSPLLSALTIA